MWQPATLWAGRVNVAAGRLAARMPLEIGKDGSPTITLDTREP
jgi:hypothetical protein